MNQSQAVGQIVANSAHGLVPTLIHDPSISGVTTRAEALTAIERVVMQSPAMQSERVWAVVFAVLTAVLAVPEVQALLGPWAPVATAAVSAALAGWSKASDPRPTR